LKKREPQKNPSKESEYALSYKGKRAERMVLKETPKAALKEVRSYRGAVGDGPRGWSNMLISGDNLPVMKTLLSMRAAFNEPPEHTGPPGVRLVYIDPPFSTLLTFKGKNKEPAYSDTLAGAQFVEFLRRRLIFLRELLADDGSIYVHLDWKMAHYVKVVMDELFGADNFLNDIIWHYGGRGAKAISRQFPRNHDIILLYKKKKHLFNKRFVDQRVKKRGSGFRCDDQGRWFKTAPRGDYTDKSIRALEEAGRVYRTRTGNIRIKYFLKEVGGELVEEKLVGDVWGDIPDAMHLPESEKTGYPTQKPERLLARIIGASTAPGDIVLDAFSGAGTTLVAAEKLGRRWIGIDSSALAIDTAVERLQGINGTKDPKNPKKQYAKEAKAFTLYKATGGLAPDGG
jgi:DNA modification methylase